MTPAGTTDTTLVVADEWVVDDVSRARLEHVLALAAPEVVGIAATTGALAPGASYRVHAERAALAPLALPGAATTAARGAVLVRGGTPTQLRDDVVDVDGTVLVDPGAHAHDPWRPVDPLEVASVLSRPPFPRRPVVALLSCEPDPDLVDWARRTANNLVRAQVEARLSVTAATEGLHLARPCTASAASIRALDPDVVVPLDGTARGVVHDWLGDDRTAVVVEFDPTGDPRPELVPWRIGRASGQSRRVRARVARSTDVRALVPLVHRLCAGPHPLPPRAVPVALGTPAPTEHPARHRDRSRSIVAATGPLDDAGRARVDALLDHASAIGLTPHSEPLHGRIGRSTTDADLVVLHGATVDDDLLAMVERRRQAGRATVVDLGASDVEPSDADAGDAPTGEQARLRAGSAALVAACGLAVAPTAALLAVANGHGARTLLVPPLLTRARAAELRATRRIRVGTTAPVLGWHLGEGSPHAHLDALATALRELLTDVFDLSVEILGDRALLPEELVQHGRVLVAPGPPEPAAVAGWSAAAWTRTPLPALVDPVAVVETASLGVPVVTPAVADDAYEALVIGGSGVEAADDPTAWHERLHGVVTDAHEHASRTAETTRRADALFGAATSAAVLNRLAGWALEGRRA